MLAFSRTTYVHLYFVLLGEAFMGSVDMCRTFWIKAKNSSALFFNESKLPWGFEMKQCLTIFALRICVWVHKNTRWLRCVNLDSCLCLLLYLWFYLQQDIICAFLRLGKHLCHMSCVGSLDKKISSSSLLPALSPTLFHQFQVLLAASFQFGCVGESWSAAMREGGRWWHSFSSVIGLSIPIFRSQCSSFLQQVAKLC